MRLRYNVRRRQLLARISLLSNMREMVPKATFLSSLSVRWAVTSSVSSPAIPTKSDYSFVSSLSFVFCALGCNSVNFVISSGYRYLVLELFQTHIGGLTGFSDM